MCDICNLKAAFLVAKSCRLQGSMEYIMMLAAASLVIVLAVTMVVKMKQAVVHNITIGNNSMSIAQAISSQLQSISNMS